MAAKETNLYANHLHQEFIRGYWLSKQSVNDRQAIKPVARLKYYDF